MVILSYPLGLEILLIGHYKLLFSFLKLQESMELQGVALKVGFFPTIRNLS